MEDKNVHNIVIGSDARANVSDMEKYAVVAATSVTATVETSIGGSGQQDDGNERGLFRLSTQTNRTDCD